jgi:hypothetical protein
MPLAHPPPLWVSGRRAASGPADSTRREVLALGRPPPYDGPRPFAARRKAISSSTAAGH